MPRKETLITFTHSGHSKVIRRGYPLYIPYASPSILRPSDWTGIPGGMPVTIGGRSRLSAMKGGAIMRK